VLFQEKDFYLTFEREAEICSGFSQAGIFFADQKINLKPTIIL